MKNLALIAVVLVALPLSAARSGEPSQQPWSVGYAEADITPKPGQAMMAGFGRERYDQGTLIPLRAQVLAIEDRNGNRALLITADVLGFCRVSVNAIRHKIKAAHGVPPKAVCLCASHTHWGPAINYRENFAIGGLNVWYLQHLEDSLLKLVGDAIANLEPAAISWGGCEAQIGMCRRKPNDQGVIGWGPYPEGSYDKQTPVLRVTRGTSPQQIVLVGHACHPTSTGPVGKWSADYPGAMRQRLETQLNDCRAMFVMGCGADAKVVYTDPKTGQPAFASSPEQSRAGGVKLANRVLAFLDSDNMHPLNAELQTRLVRGKLTFAEPPSQAEIEKMAFAGNPKSYTTWWARQSLAYPDHRRTQHYEVQTWQLGNLTLVALEGEVCADWGDITRGLAPTEHAMVIAYANNVAGYIPTARIVREGGYEGNTSHMAYFLPAPFETKVEAEVTELLRRAMGP